ncbi:MAG TPA: hypothetical protein VI756_18685 [Blastocatellia bacterium]
MGTSLICTCIVSSEHLKKLRSWPAVEVKHDRRRRGPRHMAGSAQVIAATFVFSSSSLADVRGPYFVGGGTGSSLAMLGFFLSLSLAVAGIWFFWYRRRGGSRLKSWIIASVIAIGTFLLMGVVTTFLALG